MVGAKLAVKTRTFVEGLHRLRARGGRSPAGTTARAISVKVRMRAVLLEDGVARDNAFQLKRIRTIDHWHENIVVDVAQGGIEREVRIKARERLFGEDGTEGEFSLAFLEEALEAVSGDDVPSGGVQAHQESGIGRILNAARAGVDVILGAENGSGDREHGVFDAQDGFFAIFFERGKDESILAREQVEDGN